jgi:hypothetical protein
MGVDDPGPEREILMTTQANLIWCDGKAQDRNEASMRGIRFLMEGPVTADTLHIVVDLSAYEGRATSFDQGILTQTLWCGLVNARQNWPRVHFVTYSVRNGPQNAEGRSPYSSLEGTYSLKTVPQLESPADWFYKSGPKALEEHRSP